MADNPAPGPIGWPWLGNALELRQDAFGRLRAWQRCYGDVVRYRLGSRLFHLISHPALAETILIDRQETYVKMYDAGRPNGLALVLGRGLVTSRDELWQRQRRLLQPGFQRSRVAGFGEAITAAGRTVLARWETLPHRTAIRVDQEMMRATLEVITRTMLSLSVLERVGALAPALGEVLAYSSEQLRNPLLPPLWLPTPRNRRSQAALRVLDDLVAGWIEARRRSGERHDDLLDTLLDGWSRGDYELRQVHDEVLTIFIAGHETTAVALTWTWHL